MLGSKDLALLDRHLEPVVEPGEFEVQVGSLKGRFLVDEPDYQPYVHARLPYQEEQP